MLFSCGSRQERVTQAEASRDEIGNIARTLDDWHAAAAASDEVKYFSLMAEDSVFLGTDATERWNKKEFQAYAHKPFSESRGWKFLSVRRAIAAEGHLAFFDEDLSTENMGPARGSGVLRREAQGWRIVQYNLALTIPNDRFQDVHQLLQVRKNPNSR